MALPGAVSLLLAALSFTSATPLCPSTRPSHPTRPSRRRAPRTSLIRPAGGQISPPARRVYIRRPRQAPRRPGPSSPGSASRRPVLRERDRAPDRASVGGARQQRRRLPRASRRAPASCRGSTGAGTRPAGGRAGLYQALTYHAGLSGGAWLLSSLAGNDWPSVSALESGLWGPAVRDGMLEPGGARHAAFKLAAVAADVVAKSDAGFDTSLVDPWGRLLSLQLLAGGGAGQRLSGITGKPAFRSASVPYPIMTAVNLEAGQCIPCPANAMVDDATSTSSAGWDAGFDAVRARTGVPGHDSFAGGAPATASRRVANFDNLGFMFGTSSDIFVTLCSGTPIATAPMLAVLADAFAAILGTGRSSSANASAASPSERLRGTRNPLRGPPPGVRRRVQRPRAAARRIWRASSGRAGTPRCGRSCSPRAPPCSTCCSSATAPPTRRAASPTARRSTGRACARGRSG